MIDNKKEQERDELHRTIWNMANDLRGSVDGWDFKQYVLGMLFYRYISENFVKFVNAGELEAGNKDFDYAKLDDEDAEERQENYIIFPLNWTIKREQGSMVLNFIQRLNWSNLLI